MNNLDEVRRVRMEMSQAAGHDVRQLITHLNQDRCAFEDRVIDPGTSAETTMGAGPGVLFPPSRMQPNIPFSPKS